MGKPLEAEVVPNPGPSLLINKGAHEKAPSDLSVFASCVMEVGEKFHSATKEHTTCS